MEKAMPTARVLTGRSYPPAFCNLITCLMYHAKPSMLGTKEIVRPSNKSEQ